MLETHTISPTEIAKYLKLSFKISDIIQEIEKQQLIEKIARDKEIIITEEELQKTADRFRFQNNLLSSQDTLKWLKKHDLSIEEFEKSLYNTALYNKVAQYMVGDRVEPYFYEHQLDYTQAIIYQIVLKDFDLALELFYSIQERELSFWDAAHQYIKDTELRRCGGYQGIVTRSQLKPEISAAVFASSPPEILKPIQINKKTYLILVEEIVQLELDKQLRDRITTKLFEQWLKKQM